MNISPLSFCGAWAIDGGPVDRLIPEPERRAMIQEFGAAPVKAVEVSQGPLWLAAAPGNLMRAQGRFLAVEGYLPDIAGLEEPNPAEPRFIVGVRGAGYRFEG